MTVRLAVFIAILGWAEVPFELDQAVEYSDALGAYDLGDWSRAERKFRALADRGDALARLASFALGNVLVHQSLQAADEAERVHFLLSAIHAYREALDGAESDLLPSDAVRHNIELAKRLLGKPDRGPNGRPRKSPSIGNGVPKAGSKPIRSEKGSAAGTAEKADDVRPTATPRAGRHLFGDPGPMARNIAQDRLRDALVRLRQTGDRERLSHPLRPASGGDY